MHLTMRTDGGSRGNPGPAGVGVYICDDQDRPVFSGGYYLGQTTNNVAEYEGLLRGLKQAAAMGATELSVFCDSELIVKQVNGLYKVKNAGLRPLYEQVREAMKALAKVTVRHTYREGNQEADTLANRAMDARANVGDAAGGDQSAWPTTDLFGAATTPVVAVGSAKVDLAVLDLRERVDFGAEGAARVALHGGDGLTTELVCVQGGRRYTVAIHGAEATMTVMLGKGKVTAGPTQQLVKPATWLSLAGPGTVELEAAADEKLVVILTVRTAPETRRRR